MQPYVVVFMHIGIYAGSRLLYAGISRGIDVFMLNRPPEPFNNDVAFSPALRIHGYGYLVYSKCIYEALGGILRTLVGVEYLRLSV